MKFIILFFVISTSYAQILRPQNSASRNPSRSSNYSDTPYRGTNNNNQYKPTGPHRTSGTNWNDSKPRLLKSTSLKNSQAIMMAEKQGYLIGYCSISKDQTTIIHSFKVLDDSMVAVGAFGIKVQVLNNMTNAYAEPFYALGFSVSRDDGRSTFRNPPILCPSSPIEARLECEEINRRNETIHPVATQTHFAPVFPNPGILSSDLMSEPYTNADGTISFDLAAVAVNNENVYDGLVISETIKLRDLSVMCEGTYYTGK